MVKFLMVFNILDESTWGYASQDKSFIWKGDPFINSDTEKEITEKEMVLAVNKLN